MSSPVRVVRGEPDDAELAALTVVLAAAAGPAGAPGNTAGPAGAPGNTAGPAGAPGNAAAPWSAWNDPAARLRRPLPVGPGAWRTSLRPS